MLMQAKVVSTMEEGEKLIASKIESKEGLDKLAQLVKAQGGDESYIYHPEKFERAKYIVDVVSSNEGYIKEINALEIGEAAMKLGAGRATKEDVIDPTSGIVLNKKVGSFVKKSDVLCTIYTNKEDYLSLLEEVKNSFKFSDEKVKVNPIIYEVIA